MDEWVHPGSVPDAAPRDLLCWKLRIFLMHRFHREVMRPLSRSFVSDDDFDADEALHMAPDHVQDRVGP